jgi:hypothetical protein
MAIPDPGGEAGDVLPRLLVAVAVTVTLLLRPAIVSDLAHSRQAWLVSLGVVVTSAVVRRVVARRSAKAAPWVAAAVTLGLFAVVVAPAFRERTLHEDFPAATSPVADVVLQQPSPSPTPTPTRTTAPAPRATATRAPSRAPSASARPVVTATAAAPVTAGPVVPSPSSTPVVTLLSAGQLDGLGGHHASGRVALYRVGDGTVLRFEDVDITGGAKPSVHLVPPGQHRPEGGVPLGPLKAEHGSFHYSVPSSVDVSSTVLIWCEPYDVPIGAADLH